MTTDSQLPSRKGPTPVRTWITVGTLAASLLTSANKFRKANGSTDYVDHVDVIASFTTFFVLAVRAGRGLKRRTP
ncbi:hypothetical protein [Streptomyces sp. HPF1205]|uniref:hypothetical protein n=1 Tax=Streptomyces sp. HPF1205 TaxID=2873262 RepID=UPI001CECC880|nr:hypothetical protein [Streptomyces sp. HPF1205]